MAREKNIDRLHLKICTLIRYDSKLYYRLLLQSIDSNYEVCINVASFHSCASCLHLYIDLI